MSAHHRKKKEQQTIGQGQGRRSRRSRLPLRRSVVSEDLLLEIGTEELPAAYLPGLIHQLRGESETLFQANHLSFQRSDVFGTPRRLVLIVRKLSVFQHRPAEEIRGPSKQASYDASGKPTKALLGFLRSRGGQLDQTKIVPSEKGEHVFLIKSPSVVPTAQILPQLLPQLIQRLRTPKAMRWEDTGFRFARPIRWLLTLYGSRPIRFFLAGVNSQARTRIGRPQEPQETSVTSIPAYFQTLKRVGIILDQDKRRQRIQQLVQREAKRVGGVIAREMRSHGLLEEVTYLTEVPTLLAGEFGPEYLELPREVLLASMAKYQRVFAVESRGKLLPRFVAILEGKSARPNAVRKVIERILNARLADSLLFWKQDLTHSLTQMNEGLAGLTFIPLSPVYEEQGSMQAKILRLQGLSKVLVHAWNLRDPESEWLRQACEFSKADLVSTTVKEFPTLQGVMGKYYACQGGKSQEIAEAIGEHYLPSGDKLPKTLIGSALSVLDKYDTLVSYFGANIVPTGDEDPYGLRRAAQGIVEVAWAIHRPLPFQRFREVFTSEGWFPSMNLGNASDRVKLYLLERLYTFSWPKPRPTNDCVDAVLASSPDDLCDDLVDVMDRIAMLARLKDDPALVKATKVVERTHNILKATEFNHLQVDSSQLQDPIEIGLWETYCKQKESIREFIGKRDYAEATQRFGDVFFGPIHEFFAKVMVNVPDERLRRNRLALMQAIKTLYTERIADLSKLVLTE